MELLWYKKIVPTKGRLGARVMFHFVTVGNLRYFDGDDNENVKKAIG